MTDPRFFTLAYSGRIPLRSVTLWGETDSPTAPGTQHAPLSDGIVFDPRPFDGTARFRNDGFPCTSARPGRLECGQRQGLILGTGRLERRAVLGFHNLPKAVATDTD